MRMPFVNVAGLSEIPPGAGSLVTGARRQAHGPGRCRGPDPRPQPCLPVPRRPFAEGTSGGFVVSCPWQGWTLEVRTGLPDHPGERSVAAHEVRVEGGAVSVERIKSP